MSRAGRAALLVALAVLAGATGLALGWMVRSGGQPAAGSPASDAVPRPRVAGDFALLDTTGGTVRWADIRGRWQLVFFGFTHCPEACPTTLANASRALDDPGLAGRGLRVLFISVDPDRDTPEIVGNYVGRFGPRVTGLTSDLAGEPAGLASAAAAFGVFFEKMPALADGDYMVNHTATLFLLGPTDEILETLPYGATATEIADAVKRHL